MMANKTRKIILLLAGQTGSTILSIGVLLGVLIVSEQLGALAWQMVACILVLRLFNRILRKPKPVLITHSIPMRTRRVLEDELVIGVGFCAATYLMSWPLDQAVMGLILGVNLGAQILLMMAARTYLRLEARRARKSWKAGFEKQALILGTGKQARKIADTILDSPEMETLLIGFLDYNKQGLYRYRDVPLLGHPDSLAKIVATCQIDALVIAVEPQDLGRTREVFDIAEKMGVTVCLMPEVFNPSLARVRPSYLKGIPTLLYRAVPDCPVRMFMKSIMDRLGALAGLILSAPIMALAALAIKLDSKGPVFFRQTRSGLNGKPFKMLKFRTMVANAESQKEKLQSQNEMSGPVFKMKRDPRITKVGRILRKYSIDEFPQFINVLKGEMSIVGPRPPLPKEVAKYEPWQHRKLSVKPGVTCLWQVSGRNNIDFEDWMKLDLEYIDRWSLWEDTKIIARTIPAVMKTDGAS